MHLFSLLTLGSLFFTGLAIDTENHDICLTTDKGWCTVTVNRHSDHGSPGQPSTAKATWAHVLDNECNSILDSTDCDSENEVGTLCKQWIEDEASVELPVTKDSGLAHNFYVEEVTDGSLRDSPPIFTVRYGDGAPVSDEEDSNDHCTCAQSVHKFGIVDDQVCSCWIKCSD